MKNNYTTFIADLEIVNYYNEVEKWTTIVYKTESNNLFISDEQTGRFKLVEIGESVIKHIYG